MQALNSAEIFSAFDLIDRDSLSLPPQIWVPWADFDYFAWKHPTEARTFMVVPLPERDGQAIGLVLKTYGSSRAGMCDLCYGVDRINGSILAMADTWQRPRTSIGARICAGFDCSDGARGLKWIYGMGETISTGRRIERLQENVARFARQVAGLQPIPERPAHVARAAR